MAKKTKPVGMFEEGKSLLKEKIEKKSKKGTKKKEPEQMEEKKIGDTEVKCIIRKAGKAYEFVEIEANCKLDQVLHIKGWADDALSMPVTSEIPQIKMQKVSVPSPEFSDGGSLDDLSIPQTPEMEEEAFDERCKYCRGSMWNNTTPNPKFSYDKYPFKPKYSCKSKECGASYFTENEAGKKWYKPKVII